MRIPAAGEDHKCAVFGAVDYASGHVIFQVSASKGEDAFQAFLEQLAHELPADEPVVVVLDNVGYHKSHATWDTWRQFGDRFHTGSASVAAHCDSVTAFEFRVWAASIPIADANLISALFSASVFAAAQPD